MAASRVVVLEPMAATGVFVEGKKNESELWRASVML